MKYEWKGFTVNCPNDITVDWGSYHKAIEERWDSNSPSGLIHCNKHNTLFDGHEEPCWECWDEFRRYI